MIKPDLIGPGEAASTLGMPRVSFNRLAASGKIPVAVKVKGKTGIRLFNRADIVEFARARMQLTQAKVLAQEKAIAQLEEMGAA